MAFRFGSFNLRHLNGSEKNGGILFNNRNTEKIASIIRDANFTVVALQEVTREDAVKVLVRQISSDWKYCFGYRKGFSHASEGYAFIYNSRVVDLVSDRIIIQYKVDRGMEQTKFAREPYYARFRPKAAPRCEFRLINVHIMFGKNSGHDENISLSSIPMRINEYLILAKSIYPKEADKSSFAEYPYAKGEATVPYTIILGDYNLNLSDTGAKDKSATIPRHCEIIEISGGAKSKRIITCQRELTTIKKPSDDDQNPIYEDFWSNNYDHFTFDQERFEGITISCGRIDTVSMCKDYKEHFKEISDHVPIYLDIDLRNGR